MVSSCQLKIELDKSKTGGTFTNYDIINGVINLNVSSELTLSAIEVKLEGISKTVIEIPRETRNSRRQRRRSRGNEMKPIIEIHKLLYDTSIVFPPKNVRSVSSAKEFTLIPGEYIYPFKFRIPLKNTCSKHKSTSGISNKFQFINGSNTNTSSGSAIEFVTEASKHLETKLPPSLSGLKDFATIRYFIKVTAKRPGLFKNNIRSFEPFIFLPIDSSNINFADDRQTFTRKEFTLKDKLPQIVACYPGSEKSTSTAAVTTIRASGSSSGSSSGSPSSTTSRPDTGGYDQRSDNRSYLPNVKPINLPVYFEVRFRYPAFLIPTKTPNYKLYLVSRISPEKFTLPNGESSGLGIIYMKALKIELYSETTVLIQGHKRSMITREKILELKGINSKYDLANCNRSNAKDISTGATLYELEIDSSIFKDAILPDFVAPSFKTCNISRKNTIKFHAGFSSDKQITLRDPLTEVSIETDVVVLSGLQAHQDDLAPPNAIFTNNNGGSSSSLDSSFSSSPTTVPANHENQNQDQDQNQEQDVAPYSLTPNANDVRLPTYDEVLHQTDQTDRRRRFQQSEQYYVGNHDLDD
ncbi:hypothetical protein PACTADRAFT_46925 [Pachysolen tannophilus NRRL Y-2460]|uniref:Arrestin-like N-terminal domain-containing protein n=1 Tax=Pachysolen tannophilus NRRL Y-2460 TaxID=669874 RepID=A0A1E4TND9_PACTA|nr:hypothetical protein PACTADRAFT_46925 [Pachysolen tannophilus NRRL Y-2460]